MRRGFLIVAGMCAYVSVTAAQLPKLPHFKIPTGRIDDLAAERMLNREPPITSSLRDAVSDVAYLDGYDPPAPIPMTAVGADADGVYDLFGGDFTLTAESYCLHAGTHAPGSGDGYAMAPLRGPESDIVRHVLQHSVAHPEIPQPRIQLLLWSILARAKVSGMAPDLQSAARTLLDRQEISRLDGGAIGKIPESVMDRLRPRLPPAVERFVEVDAHIRDLAERGSDNYDEWRRIAVLPGEAPPDANDRPIPAGRWSYHPDGYFVRYIPSSYMETRIDVSVPRPITIGRDAKGRIHEIRDGERRLALAYNDSSDVAVDQSTRAVTFAAVTYYDREASVRGAPVLQWKNEGWTLVGRPAVNAARPSARFADLPARYERASRAVRNAESSLEHLHLGAVPNGADDVADVVHVRAAVDALIAEHPHAVTWPADIDAFLLQAWETAFAGRAGVQHPGDDPAFDPSGGAAMPGQTGKQRLAQSGRPRNPPQPHCDSGAGSGSGDGLGNAVAQGMSAAGFSVGGDQIATGDKDGLSTFSVRTRDGCALPSMACIQAQAAAGNVPPGSVTGANNLVVGSVQQVDGHTRVVMRTVDVETGVVESAGKGDADGTGPDAIKQAADAAAAAMGGFGGSCGG